MAMLSKPAFGPRAAIIYITTGTLLDVWTAVWYFAFARPSTETSNTVWFWLCGLFLTGITLVVIGLLLGSIGQSARKAELPPTEAVNAEAQIQQTAAAAPHPIMATAPQAVPAQAPAPVARNAAAPVQNAPVAR